MTPTRKRRLKAVLLILAGLSVAAAIATWSLQQNLLYFQSPSQLSASPMPEGRDFRLGGLVKAGSVARDGETLAVRFVVTDGPAEVSVRFEGILPDLFREGKGVIAIGALDSAGTFQAHDVLAKHDENYMPPEVAEALREAGHPVND
jgi:cytochrome c-type biogenesis protein CcmE